MGGATAAAALASTSLRIVILERGERLADTAEARDPDAIFAKGHFRPNETWLAPDGTRFNPGNYACVGGNTKFYGAVLMRYRAQDFQPLQHLGGRTPGWPISYTEMEPWYQKAEELYRVRGALGDDPTEPPHSGSYPFPPVPHEPDIADLARRLRSVGLHPSPLPLGVDVDRWLERAATPWDAFPDTTGAKMDAESVALAEALKQPNVELRTGTEVVRLDADGDGTITGVCLRNGEVLQARTIVLAAGAVRTAALLLASGSDH